MWTTCCSIPSEELWDLSVIGSFRKPGLGGNFVERRHTRVSYVKKPLAKRSFMSIGLVTAGLCLFAAGMYLSIENQGQAPLNVAAMVFCSLVLNLVGVWYGALSFLEKEKNYILAKVGIVVGGLEIFAWILIMIVGIGG